MCLTGCDLCTLYTYTQHTHIYPTVGPFPSTLNHITIHTVCVQSFVGHHLFKFAKIERQKSSGKRHARNIQYVCPANVCTTATPVLEGLAGQEAAGQRQCRHETALCTCVGLQKRACRWVWPPGGPDESTCRESGEEERGGREGEIEG